MDEKRYQAEIAVLKNHLPENTFLFLRDERKRLRLRVAARTNRGNVYTLCMKLDQFPLMPPRVFVTRMLKDKEGNELKKCSSAMHVLSPEDGWTRICHYGADAWTPMVSLFKVFVKCRLWLEMYELHLQTGRNIDYYLNHQQ